MLRVSGEGVVRTLWRGGRGFANWVCGSGLRWRRGRLGCTGGGACICHLLSIYTLPFNVNVEMEMERENEDTHSKYSFVGFHSAFSSPSFFSFSFPSGEVVSSFLASVGDWVADGLRRMHSTNSSRLISSNTVTLSRSLISEPGLNGVATAFPPCEPDPGGKFGV